MKAIIAGGRDIEEGDAKRFVREAVKASGWEAEITEIVHGDARGVDRAANDLYRGWKDVSAFPAMWKVHGRAAGPIRNKHMAQYADALIAVWDGQSRGTRNMIETARDHGLKVYVHRIDARNATDEDPEIA